MTRTILLSACLTGAFCAVFSLLIGAIVDSLSLGVAIVLSFMSGFFGSIFARFVLKKGQME